MLMSDSPVSTVILPKRKTAMLSTNDNRDNRIRQRSERKTDDTMRKMFMKRLAMTLIFVNFRAPPHHLAL